MGHYFIVGFDVELDEPMKGREVVQRMKVEPRVFQGSPECFDYRIREGHLDLSQNPRQFLAVEPIIDGALNRGLSVDSPPFIANGSGPYDGENQDQPTLPAQTVGIRRDA